MPHCACCELGLYVAVVHVQSFFKHEVESGQCDESLESSQVLTPSGFITAVSFHIQVAR